MSSVIDTSQASSLIAPRSRATHAILPHRNASSRQYRGAFETHVTIEVDQSKFPDVTAFALSHALKFTHIVLPRGQHPSQPMLTRRGTGTMASELDAAARLSDQLVSCGFDVCRIKLEASPRNEDIPQHDHESEENRYFESHIKILIPTHADLDAVTSVSRRHHAHTSRNAFRTRPDGFQERFITQRYACAGYLHSQRALRALIDDLRPLGHPIIKCETEYVVYDSNMILDDGWMTGE